MCILTVSTVIYVSQSVHIHTKLEGLDMYLVGYIYTCMLNDTFFFYLKLFSLSSSSFNW